MKIYIVIPAHNEAVHLPALFESLIAQTLSPEKIILVDDGSSDETYAVALQYLKKFNNLQVVKNDGETKHQPGGKVVRAFLFGLNHLDEDYDILMKLDADLVLPENYLHSIAKIFKENPKAGMAGGVAAVKKKGNWQIEKLTDTDHIRGALKAYRKACYQEIGGLIPAMGWDTLDEMLARYYGWEICVDTHLLVKHLRPTGNAYTFKAALSQGMAFYSMRYGFMLALAASIKLASRKSKSLLIFCYYTFGFWQSVITRKPFLISKEVGKFIRQYRWKKIRIKYF